MGIATNEPDVTIQTLSQETETTCKFLIPEIKDSLVCFLLSTKYTPNRNSAKTCCCQNVNVLAQLETTSITGFWLKTKERPAIRFRQVFGPKCLSKSDTHKHSQTHTNTKVQCHSRGCLARQLARPSERKILRSDLLLYLCLHFWFVEEFHSCNKIVLLFTSRTSTHDLLLFQFWQVCMQTFLWSSIPLRCKTQISRSPSRREFCQALPARVRWTRVVGLPTQWRHRTELLFSLFAMRSCTHEEEYRFCRGKLTVRHWHKSSDYHVRGPFSNIFVKQSSVRKTNCKTDQH